MERPAISAPTEPNRLDAGPVPGDGLLHPLPLCAIGVLVLNDHLFKAAFPGLLTGKLSDFAGLAFFPLFLQAGWEALQSLRARPAVPSRRALIVAVVATAVVFALVKVWHLAGELYRWGLGLLQWPVRALAALLSGRTTPGLAPVVLVRDPTDLIALPAVLLALAAGRRRWRTASGRLLWTDRERL